MAGDNSKVFLQKVLYGSMFAKPQGRFLLCQPHGSDHA